MLTETFHAIAIAARKVIHNWRAMLLLAIVYAGMLSAVYFFVVVREASLAQIGLTLALAICAPLLFFILQTMIASVIANEMTGEADSLTTSSLIKKSLANFWKLLLVSLPLIALAILVAYILGRAQARLGVNAPEAATDLARRMAAIETAHEAAQPIDWKAALLSTVRYLIFGLVLPLAAIHLWLATAQEGLGPAIKRIGSLLSRAFAPESILIYIAGFLVFGLIPYFLLFKTTAAQGAWLEILFLSARLAAIFALTLFGWVVTMKALAEVWANAPAKHAANEAA
jgi:hypothetical protein